MCLTKNNATIQPRFTKWISQMATANTWHLEKKVPLGLIISVLILIAGQIYSYGENASRFANLEEKVDASEAIHMKYIASQFATRDLQIEVLANDVAELKTDFKEFSKETRDKLQEILIKIQAQP